MDRKILIVDDEKNIVDIIAFNLKKEGYTVITAADGEEGVQKAMEENPDLILLDIMMPKMDGYEVCKKIREKKNTPIIMLTARAEELDKVLGLELGADDYVVKPFELTVLYSRMLALLRRAQKAEETKLFCDDLVLDKERLTVSRGQKEIVLSQSEYHLLLLLMENKGKTITRTQLLEQIWDNHGHFVNNNTLTVTVKRLREKLCNPTCLKTVRSFGYRMEDTI